MITGANGHLGIRLIRALNNRSPDTGIVALVRSERAAETIRRARVQAIIKQVDYRNAAGIASVAEGCDTVVNLVGIIKESRANTFRMAHEEACQALVDAGLGASRIISLSILGSKPGSDNACLASRANADDILLAGPVPTIVLRVPMVLGPDDYASMALARNCQSGFCFTFRASSLEQPIFSEDVVAAIIAALELPAADRVLELAGPESLPRRELISRAGRLFNKSPRVISLPLLLGYTLAGLLEMFSANPPVTRAMLGVLDHDDDVDSAAALRELGISLTPLDETLAAVLMPD